MAPEEPVRNRTMELFHQRWGRGHKIEADWIEKHPEIYRLYSGEAIVVDGEAVVAHSTDGHDLKRQIDELGIQCPLILLIPEYTGERRPYILP